jgi:hypothetical protein
MAFFYSNVLKNGDWLLVVGGWFLTNNQQPITNNVVKDRVLW